MKKSKGRKKNNGRFVKEMLESTDAKERRKGWRKDLKITESSSCATREQTLRTKLKHIGKKNQQNHHFAGNAKRKTKLYLASEDARR